MRNRHMRNVFPAGAVEGNYLALNSCTSILTSDTSIRLKHHQIYDHSSCEGNASPLRSGPSSSALGLISNKHAGVHKVVL